MQTTIINGVEFKIPDAVTKIGSNRGMTSPPGKQTGLPFNQFVWKLLNSNSIRETMYTDNQIIAIIKQEFGHYDAIARKMLNPTNIMSNLRSHFNRGHLVAGYRFIMPSFSLNNQGEIVWPESGKKLTLEQITNRLIKFNCSGEEMELFLERYGFKSD